MKKERKGITGAKYIKDETGNIIVKEEEIVERWKSCFDGLLNEANEYHLEEESKVEGPIRGVTEEEVEGLLKNIRNGKAPGPSGVTSDLLKGAGVTGVKELTKVYERIEEEVRVPEQWGESYTIMIYKEKADALMCDKYIGVRLMEHSMKVWEKILEGRLREIVEINENQFGFQHGKSTVNAIFVMRQPEERYCIEGKRRSYSMFLWTWKRSLTEYQGKQLYGH